MNPPPMPILCEVTTPLQKRVATAASTAFPPRSNIFLNKNIINSLIIYYPFLWKYSHCFQKCRGTRLLWAFDFCIQKQNKQKIRELKKIILGMLKILEQTCFVGG